MWECFNWVCDYVVVGESVAICGHIHAVIGSANQESFRYCLVIYQNGDKCKISYFNHGSKVKCQKYSHLHNLLSTPWCQAPQHTCNGPADLHPRDQSHLSGPQGTYIHNLGCNVMDNTEGCMTSALLTAVYMHYMERNRFISNLLERCTLRLTRRWEEKHSCHVFTCCRALST